MRKIIILCALIVSTCQLFAQENTIKVFQSKGLPKAAVPAKYYFDHQFFPTEQLSQFKEADIGMSTVILPDNSDLGRDTEAFVFVVPQPQKPDQDFTYIDIWICDENHKPYRVFHQDANNYGEQMALDIHILRDVVTRDSVYTDKKTQQRITRHMKSATPVVALEVQEYNGTGHGIISTLLIQCPSGTTTMMKGEKPVAVFSPLSNMLMSAEWDMPQYYLLTTSSTVLSDDPYVATDDFEIFSQMRLIPILKFYTPSGELLDTYQFPTDQIDMIR